MLDTEDTVRRLLADAVSDVPSGIDLLSGVRKRQAARRTRTRAAFAAAATAVIAAGTTVGLTVSQAPSALAAVTAAAARTSAQSYRFSITITVTPSDLGGQRGNVNRFYGIFNPRLGTGKFIEPTYFNPALPRGEQHQTLVSLLVGGFSYVSTQPPFHGKHWLKVRSPFNSPLAGLLPWSPGGRIEPGWIYVGPPATETVSPAELLTALRSVAKVREVGPAFGPRWSGTQYAFTVSGRLSGTVDVDQQGRVRMFEVTAPATITSQSGHGVIAVWTTRAAFGDFGVAVHITAPPASDTYATPLSP